MEDISDLIISNSLEFNEQALYLTKLFQDSKLKVWIGNKARNVQVVLNKSVAIRRTPVFILCLSKSYESNADCMQEYILAVKEKKKIVPIILEDGFKLNKDVFKDVCENCYDKDSFNKAVLAVKTFIGILSIFQNNFKFLTVESVITSTIIV